MAEFYDLMIIDGGPCNEFGSRNAACDKLSRVEEGKLDRRQRGMKSECGSRK